MSVNVSAREVQEPGFIDGVRTALAEHAIEPQRLVIELTETALLRATPTTVATLQGLRDLGVQVVIDDFGTGYFSLSHLRQFPVDALKIAREFTQEDADEAERTKALAAAIVAMARSLGIETVAEGIETVRQHDRMRDMQCTYGQGYFYARPLVPEELEASFQVRSAARAEEEALAEAQAEALASRRSRRASRKVLSPVA
jgi:EAL domain-containing protein (putative c-di-GMP-specific phosphodiesterase class I)